MRCSPTVLVALKLWKHERENRNEPSGHSLSHSLPAKTMEFATELFFAAFCSLCLCIMLCGNTPSLVTLWLCHHPSLVQVARRVRARTRSVPLSRLVPRCTRGGQQLNRPGIRQTKVGSIIGRTVFRPYSYRRRRRRAYFQFFLNGPSWNTAYCFHLHRDAINSVPLPPPPSPHCIPFLCLLHHETSRCPPVDALWCFIMLCRGY